MNAGATTRNDRLRAWSTPVLWVLVHCVVACSGDNKGSSKTTDGAGGPESTSAGTTSGPGPTNTGTTGGSAVTGGQTTSTGTQSTGGGSGGNGTTDSGTGGSSENTQTTQGNNTSTNGGGGSSSDEPLPCTDYLDGATLSELQSAINMASGGSVICVPQGTTFQGTLEIDNPGPSADNRVTVCAATPGADECSSDRTDNPTLEGNGAGVVFGSNSDGFVIRDIDIVCASGCEGALGVDFGGANDIRLEGGTISGWEQALVCNSFVWDTPCSGIEIGSRGNPTRITENYNGFFGWLQDSFVRIDARDNGDGTVYTHHFYLSSGPQNAPSTNVVFEYGYYTRSSVLDGTSYGTFLNLSGQNQDLVIRNNVFEDDQCGTYIVDCSSGGEDPEEFCDGMEIYSNVFRSNCPLALNLASTQRARVFNNVFIGGGQILALEDGERPAEDGWVYNNTVYCTQNCETFFSFTGSDNRFFNNLIYAEAGQSIVGGGNGACGAFGGSDGPNFVNNFLYAPGNSPRFPNCGSENSTEFSSSPGFADAEGGDFHITSDSPAAGFGTAENAPANDFDGVVRPDPPSAGAFDVQ